MSRTDLLVGISALAAAVSLAATASAQVTTNTYGSGNSLFAPFLRQSEDCYGNPTALVVQGANTHSPTTINITPFNYTGSPAFNCSTTHIDQTVQLNTIQTSSGTGIKAVFSHDPVTFWGDTVPPGGNNTPYPTVNWATSETPLGTTDAAVYNSGGVEQGITFTSTPGAGQYTIPEPKYGALIQFPLIIAPLAIAYNSEYKRLRNADGTVTSYHFHIAKPRTDGSGGLVLDATTYCKIFNGQITDWNQIPTSLNGGKSFADPTDTAPFSVPLIMVGRNDSAGATSTWTRHLAAICPGLITGNQYADSTSTLPTPLQGPHWLKTNPNYGSGSGVTDTAGLYTRADGADGVADYIQFDPNNQPSSTPGSTVVQGRIGYDGTDNVLPYVLNTGENAYGLNSVSILRATGKAPIVPSAASALLAYAANILPPSGATNAAVQANWVQAASKTAAIAIPSNLEAYPIVGTSNFLGYTCYASSSVATALPAFLYWFLTSKTVIDPSLGLLAKAGSSAMPLKWRTAAYDDFLKPIPTTKAYNLNILTAGTGPTTGTGSQCNAITPGG